MTGQVIGFPVPPSIDEIRAAVRVEVQELLSGAVRPLAYSVPQIVACTPFSDSEVRKALLSGELVGVRASRGKWIVRSADLDRWLERM